MGLFALMPVIAFLFVVRLSGHVPAVAGGGAPGAILPWSAIGLVNAGVAGLFLVMTLRRARRR